MLTSWIFHAFLYSNGRMVDLGTLGCSQAGASAINNSGEIVGSSFPAKGYGHAFLYSNGKMADLGVPSGAYSSDAKGIYSIGQIVGAFYFSSQPHTRLSTINGVWTDLGAFPGATGTSATEINTAGQIVGIAVFLITSYHPFKPGKHVGLHLPQRRAG